MLNLMNARKAIHKTQQEVADYLGISRQAYSNYEAGKREPDFETLLKLGEYFGCSVDYLLGNKKDPAPKSEVTDDDIKFALFGGATVTDAQYEEVKRFAKYIAEGQADKLDVLLPDILQHLLFRVLHFLPSFLSQFATYICLYGLPVSGVTTTNAASRIPASSSPNRAQYSAR